MRPTWAKRGVTPVLRTHFNWERLAAVGVLVYAPRTQRVRLLFSLHEGTIRTERMIAVLRDLRKHVHGKAVLLWDGLGGHVSKVTRAYLATQRQWLSVEQFPGYSPELNPVEYLWANLSARELANAAPDTLAELAEGVQGGIARVRRHRDLLLGFLKHSGTLIVS